MPRIEALMGLDAGAKPPPGCSINFHPAGLVKYELDSRGALPAELASASAELEDAGWRLETKIVASGRTVVTIIENQPEKLAAWQEARTALDNQRATLAAALDAHVKASRQLASQIEAYNKTAAGLDKTLSASLPVQR